MAPPNVLAEIATEQQKVTAEIRELDLLVESTQTEVNRLKSREDQMKAKVEEVRKNPGNFQREESFGAAGEPRTAYAADITGHVLIQVLWEQICKRHLPTYEAYFAWYVVANDGRVPGLLCVDLLACGGNPAGA